MSVAAEPSSPLRERQATVRIAVVGNPNTGKSTLFNALAGMNARVGNYPGVTVEKKIGYARWGDLRVELVDLPGTYSLSPRSKDELIAVEALLGMLPGEGDIDLAMCVADAGNFERNLFLFSQILDTGKPAILILNMADSAEAAGIRIDGKALEGAIGAPVVFTSANTGRGLDDLRQAVERALTQKRPAAPSALPRPIVEETERLHDSHSRSKLADANTSETPYYLFERAILDEGGETERFLFARLSAGFEEDLRAARSRLQQGGFDLGSIEAQSRYAWAQKVTAQVVAREERPEKRLTDRVDRALTHWLIGPLVFLVTMFIVFQTIFSWASPLIGFFETLQGLAGEFVGGFLPPGALQSLIVDGIIGGVGSVVVFLPQIALLFLFIAILEDSGYMPRAAYMMDRLMAAVGLSGKSFLPLMSSFACAVPGVMATRTIDSYRDRMLTILVAPLMSCSARLPVYILFVEAFVPDRRFLEVDLFGASWTLIGLQGIVMFAMVWLGAVVAVPVAAILRWTIFRGHSSPFVMELPEYRLPSWRVVLGRVYEQCQAFIVRAGTLIFATTIVIWALGYFPSDRTELLALEQRIEDLSGEIEEVSPAQGESTDGASPDEEAPAAEPASPELEGRLAELAALEAEANHLRGELLEESFLGRIGHVIEPVVRPLGWDWRIGVATIASFPAREVVIGTLGTIFSLGGDVDENDTSLRAELDRAERDDGRKLVTLPVALSIMVFFALCAQCGSTLMVVYRETGSWRWPAFCFTYMTALAYVGALLTYQIGSRLLG
ncbi:MAG TPA: ferrous iron transport protein B [Pirellulaceae bacterium]|jgi:ferrous iron transport protein B|nr:ferrous iron transport protein B [Pirellulaceae bacterium]